MATKKGLGRGLDILLPESDMPGGTTEIALNDLDPNPEQPRRAFDREALETLAESIRQSGVLQPLLVTPEGARYRIVAGERRFRAARMAGLQTVPCVVREMDERERMEADKLQRLDQIRIPDTFDYTDIQSLSTEARQKLSRIRPKSIGEAQRIPGVSPNDVSVLLVLMGR